MILFSLQKKEQNVQVSDTRDDEQSGEARKQKQRRQLTLHVRFENS